MGHNGQFEHQSWIRWALSTYEDRLLRYARRILRDESRAQDAVQETFLKLCQEDASRLNGRLGQWLYTVCRNQSLDILRKESRMSVSAQPPTVAEAVESSAEYGAEVRDETARVLLAVEQLSESQQECLRLKFEHDLTYREIASVTGLSVSNVGFTIHNALQRLRTRLRTQPME